MGGISMRGAPADRGALDSGQTQCPACAAQVAAADLFCEACGHDLRQATATTATTAGADAGAPAGEAGGQVDGVRWVSSRATAATCAGCGEAVFGAEGYCDTCGQLRPVARDHTQLTLGTLAAVTDKGHRHHRNEDAVGLGLIAGTAVAVVCDGVSSSTRPDAASHGAVDAATPTLLASLRREPDAQAAIIAAARAAQAAAALVAGPQAGANPPSCTFVCAVVDAGAVTVGWVGDSRAYWLPDSDGEPACLTVDDSLAGRFAAAGRPIPDTMRSQAGSLVRWLGADATDTAPHLRCFAPTGPGRIVVCSDGLHRYRSGAAALAASAPREDPLRTAQELVRLALDEGGQDNIAVAVLTFPPSDRMPPTDER